MPLITRLMLQNFKKFPELDLRFTHDRNILVGDNESGKSTILLALDLVLSDSRHRVEALGVESLLSQSAVRQFQGHCCKVSDEAAFCLIQRPYISKTLLTRRISP
ncbi:AAA family ATPase, partial [Klebsiella pneumoniae]|nr:AAA family ATPase [Klebsiella pneumoniae]